MANFIVRNSLNPHKVAKLGISFTKVATKEDMTGDERWVIEIGTEAVGVNGTNIAPYYINDVLYEDIDREIEAGVSIIASQIDWGATTGDTHAPVVYYSNINSPIVSIDSNICLKIKEMEPSSGIDLSSIKLTVNDIDVTSELFIEGNPYDYTINWYPRQRIRSVFN